MKILITGNMGYVGPSVVRQLRASWPDATLLGIDTGYFAHCLTNARILPENLLDVQYFCDIRNIPQNLLDGVDAVVQLAAISNDPMGKTFEKVTAEINYESSIRLARQAKSAGVKNFVFASSCSVYGFAEGGPRKEDAPLNPLTAYAKSKINTERELEKLAGGGFVVTSLRFATACGMSDRLRLDLVLNDFVAGAVVSGKISILSDGSPWRPLIHVDDMARAIEWAIRRDADTGGNYLSINAGSDRWNYQVKELAEAVADIIPGVNISINKNAASDQRSYRVDFGLYKELAPEFQPQVNLEAAINGLKNGLESMKFSDTEFRHSNYVRLVVLNNLREENLLDEQLMWTKKRYP